LHVISVDGVGKRYGALQAVDDLSFRVDAGRVVGFLGRNGAGKSTTLKILAGLARPSRGRATIDGHAYRELKDPMRVAGFGLDAFSFHPGIPGRRQLETLAVRAGLPSSRAREVLELVELAKPSARPVKTYSLGMRQRLLLAAAMLGDPQAIVLDEPTNGLDPQGHRWLREFLRARASEGRAVLLSSHVLGDVAETVDSVVVISRGKLVADASVPDLTARGDRVRVSSPQLGRLGAVLRERGARVEPLDGEAVSVVGVGRNAVGDLAAEHGIALHELAEQGSSLEEVFFELTQAEGSGPR
jgi:ABC-2 type transport system ATP-binding protein